MCSLDKREDIRDIFANAHIAYVLWKDVRSVDLAQIGKKALSLWKKDKKRDINKILINLLENT